MREKVAGNKTRYRIIQKIEKYEPKRRTIREKKVIRGKECERRARKK
jgi:ribosomal protein S6E (S10)